MLFLPQSQLLWIQGAARLTILLWLLWFQFGYEVSGPYKKSFCIPCCAQLHPSLVITIDLVSTDSLGGASSGHLGFLKDT